MSAIYPLLQRVMKILKKREEWGFRAVKGALKWLNLVLPADSERKLRILWIGLRTQKVGINQIRKTFDHQHGIQ